MTTKQRAWLRALANTIEPSMQIGKEGVSENSIVQVSQMLDARELIKIKVLQNCDYDLKEMANLLAEKTGGMVVQTVGRIITLYKVSSKKKNRNIILPL